MELPQPPGEGATVNLVPYSPAFREPYKQLYNDCFRDMRRALDIRPYDFIQDDDFFEKGMDAVYLLTDGRALIGSVALKGSEIDDLIVAPRAQGQGYGRKILLWALHHVEAYPAVLHVAEWNARAIGLYQSLGFEITKTVRIR